MVPWAEAGVGAIATQANVNVVYGPRGLELLKQGLAAREVLDKLLADDTFEGKDSRQLAIIDSRSNIAAFTAPNAPKWAGDRQGKTWSVQGNILAGPQVTESMGRAFEAAKGELAERLYAALKADDAAAIRAENNRHQSWLCENAAAETSTTTGGYTSTSTILRTRLKRLGVCWISICACCALQPHTSEYVRLIRTTERRRSSLVCDRLTSGTMRYGNGRKNTGSSLVR
jgi:uncharacterized Ntn-hydrolase superfamily protein